MRKNKSASKTKVKSARNTIARNLKIMGFSNETIASLLPSPKRGNKKKGIAQDLGYMSAFANKIGQVNTGRLNTTQIRQKLTSGVTTKMNISNEEFGKVLFTELPEIHAIIEEYVGHQEAYYIVDEATEGRLTELWDVDLSENYNNILPKLYKVLEDPKYHLDKSQIDIIKMSFDRAAKEKIRLSI